MPLQSSKTANKHNLKALQKLATLTSSFLAVTRGPKGTLWLDENGSPVSFWAHREEDGAVIGDPIPLQ